jgi:prepilin-type N-terminal cleavage/methylation domain-containing protein
MNPPNFKKVAVVRPADKGGFTLIEVLVTLGLFSMFLVSILALSIHLGAQSKSGAGHDEAIAEARYFQQFFVQTVNSSRQFSIPSNDKVTFSLHNSDDDSWSDAVLSFLEAENKLIFDLFDEDDESVSQRILSEQVYRNGTENVFSTDGSGVRCNLYIGANSPTNNASKKIIGTFINLKATPRNRL